MAVHRRGIYGLVLLWKLSWQHTWIARRVWVELQDSHCSFIQLHSLWLPAFQFTYLYLWCLCEVILHLPLRFHLPNMSKSDLGSKQWCFSACHRHYNLWLLVSVLLIASHSSAVNVSSSASVQTPEAWLDGTIYLTLGFFSFFLINQSPVDLLIFRSCLVSLFWSGHGDCVILRNDPVQLHDREEIDFINEYWLLSRVEDFHTSIY